jgi:hypothetical protein
MTISLCAMLISTQTIAATSNSCAYAAPVNCSAEREKCKKVIDAADKAIAAKDQQIALSDLALKTCRTENSNYQEQVEAAQAANAKFYRNPFIMMLLGAAAASVTYVLLKK